MARRQVFVIEPDDARRYRESLRWARNKLIRAFEDTEDMSLRKTINKHGPVLDELIEELGGRIGA